MSTSLRYFTVIYVNRGRLNCNDINSLGLLPDKLKTELALHVNLETLKKVTIFQKCRPEFLHDLMLKMKAYIFTPGDLICRRGEVARELFIIADGVVEIIGENGTVLTRMSTGDFFGEIGILNLDGGINRYSIIRAYGQKRLRQIEQHREKMRSTPNSPVEKTDSSSYFNNNIPLPGGRNIPAKSHFLSSPALKRLFRKKFKKTGQVTNQKDHHVSRAPEVFQQAAVGMKELDTNESKLFDKPAMNYRRASTLKAIQEIPNSAENSPVLTRTEVTNTNEILENEDISMSPSKSKLSELVLNILNLKKSQHFTVESNDSDTGNIETTLSGNQKDSQCGNCSLETACVENHQDLNERTAVNSDISNDGSLQEAVTSDAQPPIPRIFLTPASSYIFK
ncbi:hypothetical protein ACJMK2_012702 [Sinanodonta woodiana]|uniref:Cyclic nucleotide-binding domain-containing protein n=1 Tax=Sinanodonta woodiana TaxID=1069815 RepID=A0ABD3VC18_SINWO